MTHTNRLDKPQRHDTPTEGLDWSLPLVSIRCITYNHKDFIRDALEGFVMQETTFPFEAIVHDDASTDGTADIILEYAAKYPHIIKPIIQKENQFSKGRDSHMAADINDTMSKTSKYVAFCEGDDYWIAPNKLQMQFDFMEANPEYSMCHTGFKVVDEQNNEASIEYFTKKYENAIKKGETDNHLLTFYKNSITRLPFYEKISKESRSGEMFWRLLVYGNYIMTLTVMFRRNVYDKLSHQYYDYGQFLTAARMGLIGFLPDVTSSYRFQPYSAITLPELHKKIVLDRTTFNIWGEFSKIFDETTCRDIKCVKELKYLIVRFLTILYFHYPSYKKKYIMFFLKHPSLWLPMLKYSHNKYKNLIDINNVSHQNSKN